MQEKTVVWLLNGGWTAHLVINNKYFHSFCELKNPIDFNLPEYDIPKDTKVGKMFT